MLDKLRALPKNQKRNVAVIASLSLTLLVVILWAVLSPPTRPPVVIPGDVAEEENPLQDFNEFIDTSRDGFAEFREEFEKFSDTIEEIKVQIETEEALSEGENMLE